jgi:hypothetical protein
LGLPEEALRYREPVRFRGKVEALVLYPELVLHLEEALCHQESAGFQEKAAELDCLFLEREQGLAFLAERVPPERQFRALVPQEEC